MTYSSSFRKLAGLGTVLAALAACSAQPVTPRQVVKPPVRSIITPTPRVSVDAGAVENVLGTPIEDKLWQLVTLPKSVSASGIQAGAFLSFQGQRLSGSTGCNRLMGSYRLNGEQLKLDELASTKIFCPGDAIVQEAMFIEALNDTTRWAIESNHLFLYNGKQETVAVFEVGTP